jgi:hypothetical protein
MFSSLTLGKFLSERVKSHSMTDQELKDLVASLAVGQAKADQKMAELAAAQSEAQTEVKETSRVLKEIGRRMGAMASNQGDVAEEFFFNTLLDKPEIGGIRFDRVVKNMGAGKPGSKQAEFDVVLHNGSSMAIVEVKYKVHPNDLEQVRQHMQAYRELFPEYKDYKLYGGIAGFSVPQDVVDQALEQGMFVLKRKGDLVEAEAQSMRAF